MNAGVGDFQDITRARFINDYYAFMSDITATRICDFARIVKQETRGKKLVVVFYGYLNYGARTAGMTQQDGFRAEQMVLDCPYIDAIASPLAYYNRGINGFDATQTANDSTKIHGKCFVAEEDTEPLLDPTQAARESFQVSHSEAVESIKREIGYALVKGMYQWFFVQRFAGGNAAAIDRHRDLLVDPIMRENRLLKEAIQSDRTSISQIAVFIDQQGPFYLKSTSQFPMSKEHIYPQLGEFDKMGAPYDLYYLSDLASIDLSKYKMIVFLGCYGVNPEIRRAMAARAKKNAKVLVWGWGSGIEDGINAMGAPCIRDLTGITMRVASKPNPMEVKVTNIKSPFCFGITNGLTFGNNTSEPLYMSPVISVTDAGADALGILNGSGETVFASKSFTGWTSLYVGGNVIPSALLRNAARVAGVNIFDSNDDTLYACKSWLVISSATAGNRIVNLPFVADVVDAWSGSVIGTQVSTFATSIKKGGETKIYRLEHSRE